MGFSSENKDFDYYSSRLSRIENLQLENMWVIQFSDDATGDMDMYITETTLPLRNIELGTTAGNVKTAEAYKDFTTYSITVLETEDFRNYKYFINWLNSIYDFTNQVFRKNYVYNKKKATIKFISIKNVTPSGHVISAPMIGLPPGLSSDVVTGINNVSQSIAKKIYKASPKEPVVYANAIFELRGMLITGIDDLNLSTDKGDPLSFTINFEIEGIRTSLGDSIGNRQIS